MANSILTNRAIKLSAVFPEAVYILIEVKTLYEYDSENKKTNIISGYAYDVVNTGTFDKITVKVLKKAAIIEPEELQKKRENGERVFVEFVNAIVKQYFSNYANSFCDTFSADDIKFVETFEIF